jgi:hypothetical protein
MKAIRHSLARLLLHARLAGHLGASAANEGATSPTPRLASDRGEAGEACGLSGVEGAELRHCDQQAPRYCRAPLADN